MYTEKSENMDFVTPTLNKYQRHESVFRNLVLASCLIIRCIFFEKKETLKHINKGGSKGGRGWAYAHPQPPKNSLTPC